MPSFSESIGQTLSIKLDEITSLIDKVEKTTKFEGDDNNETLINEINDAEIAIKDVTNRKAVDKKEISSVSKLLIRVCLCKCQLLGKDEEWEKIIETAVDVLTIVDDLNEEFDFDYLTSVKATALGYKGFSLMKMNKIDEAIIPLRESYELRMGAMKGVALVNEHRDFVNKKRMNQREKKEAIQVEKVLVACCQMKGIDAPLPPLTKFSRTAHLFDAGGTAVTSDDLVMSRDDIIYDKMVDGCTTLYVEEKVDGANFGLSLSSNGKIFAQNRSHYVSSGDHSQFSPLAAWIEENRSALTNILSHEQGSKRAASQGLILYGEWLVARHSIPYHKLPAHFIAFDIYDRKVQRFWSRSRFHTIMKGSGIPVVPIIKVGNLDSFECTAKGKTSKSFRKDLVNLLETRSQFRTDGGTVEGIILRIDDNSTDEEGNTWLKSRLKIVRPDFVGGCREGHWSRREIEKQTIDFDFAQDYLNQCYKCATNDLQSKRE
jgi:hypothetical protein